MPYLKWAGGKRALLKDLMPLFTTNGQTSTNSFYDVFAGAGTVAEAVAPHFRSVIVNDINRDLSAAHRYTVNHGDKFVGIVERFFCEGLNKEKSYLSMRGAFNNGAQAMEKAAIFVYLNKHCFNGLCRYNQRGIFNSPYGWYKAVAFPRKEMLAFHVALKDKADICSNDFENVMLSAKAGDVVYCDPPYWPLNATGFTSYASGGFGSDDQERLAKAAERCPAKVIISNHDLPETRALYASATQIIELDAARSIAANGKRGKVKELVAIYGD